MKYLLLIPLLISCSLKDCQVDPNAAVQTKIEAKTNSKTTETKIEAKGFIEQMRDLRDSLHPGAQFKCVF